MYVRVCFYVVFTMIYGKNASNLRTQLQSIAYHVHINAPFLYYFHLNLSFHFMVTDFAVFLSRFCLYYFITNGKPLQDDVPNELCIFIIAHLKSTQKNEYFETI